MDIHEDILCRLLFFMKVLSAKSLDVPKLLEQIFEILNTHFEYRYNYCFKIENDLDLELMMAIPKKSMKMGFVMKADTIPIILEAIQVNKIIFSDDLSSKAQIITTIESYFNFNLKSFVICPVADRNKVKWAIISLNIKKDSFSVSEKQLFQLLKKVLEGDNILKIKGFLEHNLVESNESTKTLDFFQSILNQLNFGILILDQKLNIHYMNNESSKLLHLSNDYLESNKLEDVLGKQNTETVRKAIISTSSAFERPEIELVTREGEKILIGFTLTKMNEGFYDNGGYILLLKDITYSKELQEEMQRMDRLASLGVMASGIAHEIRNPLAGIKAIAQTFEDYLSKNDPKREYVERIIKQVNRLDDLLKSLFSYAKPQKPNRQFYSVKEILQEVLSLLKQKIKNQKIKLTQSFQDDLPLVFVDNSQIQQVLFNVILNSIEAVESQGKINIKIEKVNESKGVLIKKPFLRSITGKPYLQMVISDNGCGISQENLQQIFNPFFTTKSFGTGLGLSIVYQIIQENNGIIYFESEPDRGTNCYLLLPAYKHLSYKNR